MYKFNKTKKRAVAALVAGSLAMSAIMVGWNIIVTPIYMGAPREAVLAMILPVILPFNLLKAAVNSVVIFLIYKPIGRFLK
jgi:riboflavin transporter FmnP